MEEREPAEEKAPLEEVPLPPGLLETPGGDSPPPPIDTAEQDLPFGKLAWEHFEKLCVRLAMIDGSPLRSRPYGVKGQAQAGIDIYSRLNDGGYITYQCKRREEVAPKDLVAAVDAFLKGEWSDKSQRFVFCTSMPLVRTELVKEIEAQADRLRKLNIAFEVWDAESLSGRLKAHPGLVEDFFGPAWLERFARQERARELDSKSAVKAQPEVGGGGAVLVINLDWAATNVQEMLKQLQLEDQETFVRLTEAVGSPPTGESLLRLLDEQPNWLIDGDSKLWKLLALMAEKVGAWRPSMRAWVGASERDDEQRVVLLCSASAAAGIAGDTKAEVRLREEAKLIDPENPRVRLAELDQERPGQERLDQIADIVADDDQTRTHLAAHRALAALLVPDLEITRRELAVLEEIAPDSAMTSAIAVNLAVQAERLNLIAGLPIDAASLRTARAEGLKLRDRLLAQKRFSESGRMLMLAADATALLGERERAANLLRETDAAELATPQIAEVLASAAAGRALDYRLARDLIAHAPTSEGKRFLEAEILEEIGNAEERAEALQTLEEIVAQGEDNASEAAFLRIAATLGGRPAKWSPEAAQYLRDHGHTKAAVVGEVMYRIKRHADYPGAEALLRPHLHHIWAKAQWLRMEIQHGRWGPMKEAADRLMEVGPSQELQLEAGRAYAKSRHYERAQEVLTRLARDPGAPFPVRTEAYRLLVIVAVKELEDWNLAATFHQEWTELDPGNPDASALAVQIANRRRHARRQL